MSNKIGWCDKTVNPVQGCPKGCEYCYARKEWKRHKGMKGWAKDFSAPEFFPEKLNGFKTRKPQIIFIDSMSDVAYWKPEWFDATVMSIRNNSQNIYLALTKNMEQYASQNLKRHANPQESIRPIFDALYNGVSITKNADVDFLHRDTDTGNFMYTDFYSFEPLLEKIDITSEWIAYTEFNMWSAGEMWWIIGDLTKNGKPQGVTQKAWVQEMIEFCRSYNIPVFMKDSIQALMSNEFVQEFPKEFIAKVGRDD